MINLNKYIIFVLKKNNFFFINFFFLKRINFIFLLHYFNKKNNFTVTLKKNKHKSYFTTYRFKSTFYFKFIRHINILSATNVFYDNKLFISNDVVTYKNIFNFLNKKIYTHINNFLNVVYYLAFNKKSFLILNNNYDLVVPVYNYIFPKTSISLFNEYFFVEPLYFTYKRWLYFYSSFCIKFNVKLLVIFKYEMFLNFISELQSLNIPLSALSPINYVSAFIDYPIFVNYNLKLNELLYIILISQFYFLGLNFKNYQYKIKFIKSFYNFSKLI